MYSYHRDEKAMIRFIAFSPQPVTGYFRINNRLQIFSLPDDAPKPERLQSFADHPFIVEYSFKEPNVDELRNIMTNDTQEISDGVLDHFFQSQYYCSKQQEILSILSVFTRYLITKEQDQHCWVVEGDEDKFIGRFAQAGYFWAGFRELGEWFSTPNLPQIDTVDANTYYNNPSIVGEHFRFSDASVSLFEKYLSLRDGEEREAYLSACVLFSQALEAWPISHSLTYIGVVSSLEALIKFDHRKADRKAEREACGECGQPKYKVRQKFLEFMHTYGNSDDSYKRFADQIYARRSGIGHQGKLLAGDVAGQVVSPGDEFGDLHELRLLGQAARICLVNWLMKR